MPHQITTPVKIITMTEDELTAKMEDFRRQIMSDIKTLLAEQSTSMPPSQENSRTGEYWVSAKDLARKYGVTINTIWRWCNSGKLPQPAKLADKRCTRWNLADVEQSLTA